MYLGIYHFDGEPEELLRAYDRMMADVPADRLYLHACAVREGGITVYDACPTKEAFEEFAAAAEHQSAAVGLPAPRIEGLPLHAARASGGAVLV